jgi:hypothetical protein
MSGYRAVRRWAGQRPESSAAKSLGCPRAPFHATVGNYAPGLPLCQLHHTTYCGVFLGQSQDVAKSGEKGVELAVLREGYRRARCAFLHKVREAVSSPWPEADQPVRTVEAGWGGIRRPPPLCSGRVLEGMCFPHGSVGEGGNSFCARFEQGECHASPSAPWSFRLSVCRRLLKPPAGTPSTSRSWVTRYRLNTSAIAAALSASVCAKTRLRSRMDWSASSMNRFAVSYCAFASSLRAR